ncbi:hypothetical protein OC845_000182 [Tilletia horrida]|nr:hypothetical protein OC845_000182 [Tilletia horrida]
MYLFRHSKRENFAGRAKYTLIEAYPAPGQAPRIKEIIVGANAEQGEVRQLLVEGGDQGWWKRSEVPLPEEGHLDQLDKTGCLISEVVIPGTFPGQPLTRCAASRSAAFDWKDHKFLRQADLQSLFGEDQDSIRRFQPFAAADAGSGNA